MNESKSGYPESPLELDGFVFDNPLEAALHVIWLLQRLSYYEKHREGQPCDGFRFREGIMAGRKLLDMLDYDKNRKPMVRAGGAIGGDKIPDSVFDQNIQVPGESTDKVFIAGDIVKAKGFATDVLWQDFVVLHADPLILINLEGDYCRTDLLQKINLETVEYVRRGTYNDMRDGIKAFFVRFSGHVYHQCSQGKEVVEKIYRELYSRAELVHGGSEWHKIEVKHPHIMGFRPIVGFRPKVESLMVGDVVVPANSSVYLRSGASSYPCAVVVSLNPFALCSEEADMLWTCTISPKDVKAVGCADTEVMKRVNKRWKSHVDQMKKAGDGK